jgi:hypothetical protein
MLYKALEWSSVSIGGRFFLRAFEIKRHIMREVKMLCKWVSLSVGAPLGNLEEIHFSGLFEEKGYHIWVPFLDPDDIQILSLGAILNFGKGTGLS